MDLRTHLDQVAFGALSDLVKGSWTEPVACGSASSHLWEVSITAIRRSEIASLEKAKPKPKERPAEAPDLSEAEANVYQAIDREPTSEAEISKRTGYKRGRNLRRILGRLMEDYDIIARRGRHRYQRVA